MEQSTNWVEDITFLLSVKLRWIPFNGCREKIKIVSANQRPGRPSWISELPRTHTNSVLRSCFLSSFVGFCSAVEGKKSEISQPVRDQGGHLGFPIGRKNINLRTLGSCFLSSFVEFRSAVVEKKSKMPRLIKCQGDHLGFPIDPEITHTIEKIKVLLLGKFRSIPFSVFREVENGLAN